MNKTNFAHIRPNLDPHSGGCTIAYTDIPRNATGNIHYAVAFCNAKDNFNKKIGRDIAEGRLAKGQYNTIFTNSSKYSDIVNSIIASLKEQATPGSI